jgi:predicted DNA-binding protein (MmcQ/YjbR family)
VTTRGRTAAEAVREAVLAQCGALPAAELTYPFGDDNAVYKVGGKMFALVTLGDEPAAATLKCDPEESIALRQAHSSITPGYYMNKQHWITVDLSARLPDGLVPELVRGSYDLVVAALPRKKRPAKV